MKNVSKIAKQVFMKMSSKDSEFKKDFEFSIKHNAGSRKELLTLQDAKDLKRRLDFIVNSNINLWLKYFPDSNKEEYKFFWMKSLKNEIDYYKSLLKTKV